MLDNSLPEEVRTTLLAHHLIQDDLLAVQVLLDEIEDLPDGARYFPLGPGSTDPQRPPEVYSPKERLQLLIQAMECYVLVAYDLTDQRIAALRKRYPDHTF